MNSPVVPYEPAIRFGFFAGILLLMALWEMLSPRRPLTTSKKTRWFANLGIVSLDTGLLRLVFPFGATGLAFIGEKEGWGLLAQFSLPYGIKVFLGVLVLDFVIYLQHAMFHGLATLFRLHMMHHTDLDFDVTTGVRFHPVEILLSMGIKIAAIAALGAPALAVLIFEVLLNGTSMFNHGNVRLPARIDRWLRLLVVTPEMHRVHHSVVIRETNSNFGFNFPWWDRLLGTYRPQPEAGHEGMTIGLSHFRDPRQLTLFRLLVLPFKGKPGKYPFSA